MPYSYPLSSSMYSILVLTLHFYSSRRACILAQLLYNPLGKRVNPETSEVAEAAAIAKLAEQPEEPEEPD